MPHLTVHLLFLASSLLPFQPHGDNFRNSNITKAESSHVIIRIRTNFITIYGYKLTTLFRKRERRATTRIDDRRSKKLCLGLIVE